MEIPKEAKCVFHGILFDVYQWEQKLFDGTTTTFEMLKRQPSVCLIPISGDKIITLIQEQPRRPTYPCVVGGHIEGNESPVESAKRELLEETGYVASNFRIIDEYYGSSKIYDHEYVIVAEYCKKGKQQKLEAGERIKIKLMSFEDFLGLCRDEKFVGPTMLKHTMYECLLDNKKKLSFQKQIFG